MTLPFKAVAVIDYETHWDAKTYTLRKLDTTDYIIDPRFAMHCCSVKTARSLKVHKRLSAANIDWSKTALIAHHCLPGDVEVLTPDGWLRLDQAEDGATVMQWDSATGALSWADDAHKIESFAETLLGWSTSFHRCAYTPEHRMYYSTPDNSTWRAETASVVAEMGPNNTYVPIAGVFESDDPIEMSAAEAALMEAFRADGSWAGKGGMRFKLKKHRKIERLRKVIKAAGLAFIERAENGITYINVKQSLIGRLFYSLLGHRKQYGQWALRLTVAARISVLQEARYWDGSERSNSPEYLWSSAARHGRSV